MHGEMGSGLELPVTVCVMHVINTHHLFTYSTIGSSVPLNIFPGYSMFSNSLIMSEHGYYKPLLCRMQSIQRKMYGRPVQACGYSCSELY